MIEFYSTNYYNYEPPRSQAVPIRVFTHETHPIEPSAFEPVPWMPSYDRAGNFHGRISAGFWKYRPDLAMPGVEVTGFLSGNIEVRDPDFAERCMAELGDDDLLLMHHPYRDCIVEEESASHPDPRFDACDTAGQVQSYLEEGLPRHWGLFFAGFLVRRDTPDIRAFNDAINVEFRRWSGQDQLIIPYLLWKMGIKWHAWADVGEWHARPFEEGWLHYAHIGREIAA